MLLEEPPRDLISNISKYYNIDCDMFPPEGRAFEDEVAMFHPDDQQAYRELILKASVGILPERPVCFRIDYTKTDNWRYIEKIITVARDGNGDVISIIGTHRDVTDLIISQRREQEAVDLWLPLLPKRHSVQAGCRTGNPAHLDG